MYREAHFIGGLLWHCNDVFFFFFLILRKKCEHLLGVSFETFLIGHLHIKDPYKPFLLALMRTKLAPEEKRLIVHVTFLGLQKRKLLLNRRDCQVQAQIRSSSGIWCPLPIPHSYLLPPVCRVVCWKTLEKYFSKDKEFKPVSLCGSIFFGLT